MLATVLTWIAPTTLANGEPLPGGFIAGYRIYRGASPASLSPVLDVPSTPTQIHFGLIPGLTAGQFVAVSAVSAAGFESALTTAMQWDGFPQPGYGSIFGFWFGLTGKQAGPGYASPLGFWYGSVGAVTAPPIGGYGSLLGFWFGEVGAVPPVVAGGVMALERSKFRRVHGRVFGRVN